MEGNISVCMVKPEKEKITEAQGKIRRKNLIKAFEDMREMAELKALSKASLERPLSEREAERMIELGRKRGLITKVV